MMPPRRLVLSTPPDVTGTYSTAVHVKPKTVAERNATAAFLGSLGHDQRGLQELYAAGIDDVPDPLSPDARLTYGELKQRFAQPATARQMYESPMYRQGNYPSSDAFLLAQFEAGKQRLLERARATPQHNAFSPAAVEALNRIRRENFVDETQQVLPDGTGQAVADADMRRRRLQLTPEANQGIAPGRVIRLR